jgi:hypothetical protein
MPIQKKTSTGQRNAARLQSIWCKQLQQSRLVITSLVKYIYIGVKHALRHSKAAALSIGIPARSRIIGSPVAVREVDASEFGAAGVFVGFFG